MARTSRLVAAIGAILSLFIALLGLVLAAAAYRGYFGTRGGDLSAFVIGLVLLYIGGRETGRAAIAVVRPASDTRPR